jgi:hypothetical protein
MATETPRTQPAGDSGEFREKPVGGPVSTGWREGVLTRAKELEARCIGMRGDQENRSVDVLARAALAHIEAAREAATTTHVSLRRPFAIFHSGPLRERALKNLDAAEADLITIAPTDYVLGQLPNLHKHVQNHLLPTDPRRQEFERIAAKLDGTEPAGDEREKIVNIMRGVSQEALREQVRLGSFRNILVVTILAMTLLAVGVAITGLLKPTLIPLCFTPEEASRAMVVCPTAQSESFSTEPSETSNRDIDDYVEEAVSPHDLVVVELVGLAAGAIATAAAIRGMRGSSERYGIPVALAVLKLPTGAVTAFLGVLLMRGQFVPGLSALDTSAQILAWALVFGYAQQLLTRFIDQQGQTILDSVRGADKTPQRR